MLLVNPLPQAQIKIVNNTFASCLSEKHEICNLYDFAIDFVGKE